ncbi:hypothetical protein LTR56_008710 [Elasticomyces elasticus]|nr:hypothetical protein LTR22_018269 [Elasticomyces elasticus]KAK3646093.1 hypothetical protein LTR56_008710 [Elasticomyces elasticus]KAK4924274.1 hypothetical protein LTR49_008574 [Elasticomyces elasticus]KAK5759167.1 hypothetical protein LTS12_010776 [Elasticomyces elasticus]
MASTVHETQPSNSAKVQDTILAGNDQLPSPPFINVEGVPNFRDLGGHRCILNDTDIARSLRKGYLFRCAQPAHITSTGIDTLTTTLNIHDTYDLRSSKEIRLMSIRYPDLSQEIPGVTRHHVPIYRDEDYTPISMAEKYQQTIDPTQNNEPIKAGFVRAYEDILEQAARSGSYRTILLHILERPQAPLVFHCTVGKDRTGVFAALVLKLCGVGDEAVVWDYALTTKGLDEVAMPAKKLPTREEAERMVGSHAEDMKAFLGVLEEEFEGARLYFRDRCGFTDAELDRVVEILTVEGEGLDFPIS